MRLPVLFLIAPILTACTAAGGQSGSIPPNALAPITCKAGADCDAKWSRATVWIAQNAPYKIQTQGPSVIQTFGPLPNDPRPAFSAAKYIQTNGWGEITFSGACDNLFGCTPPVTAARAKFADFVNGK